MSTINEVNGEIITRSSLADRFAIYGLPEYMVDGLWLYLSEHIPPGDFLRSVLENTFFRAVALADHNNNKCLAAWTQLVYNELPSACWGSPEAVTGWLQHREVK